MLNEEEICRRRITQRMNKALRDYRLIDEGDRVLVALSGGKDSLCLTEMLGRRKSVFVPRFSIEAVHVRMENVSYESDTTYLENFCKSWDIPLHVVTTRFDKRENGREKPACFLCSWNRRKQIFNLAQELGCNKIALGHHQDDIVQTALMNLFFQGRFDSMPPLLKMEKMPLSLIRPLCTCEEKDIALYAQLMEYKLQRKHCPFEDATNRNTMKQLMEQLEGISPNLRSSVWNALNNPRHAE